MLAAAAGEQLLVDSAGVYEGALDPFIPVVLDEVGLSLDGYEPKSLDSVDLRRFDLVIALTPEAAAEIRRAAPRVRLEFWPVENPSESVGGRAEVLSAYRAVRDDLLARIRVRFPALGETA